MEEQTSYNNKTETESKFKLSVDLINGYYLSFLAVGILAVIIKIDISSDLQQPLFFIFLCLTFGSMDLLKSASNKESSICENKINPRTVIDLNRYLNKYIAIIKIRRIK